MADPLEQVPGLGGFFARRKMIQDEGDSELRQRMSLASLLDTMERRRQAAALRQAMAESGGDAEKAIELALRTGSVDAAHQLAPLAKLSQERREREETRKGLAALLEQQAQPQPQPPAPAGPLELGQGQPISLAGEDRAPAQAPRAAPEARLAHLDRLRMVYANNPSMQRLIEGEIGKVEREMNRAPVRRERIENDITVQEERLPDGTWSEIGRGPRFARQVGAPQMRERISGGIKIQEELQADGTWKEIGRGDRFAPQRPPAGFERQYSRDFESHPVVKGYLDLQPDVTVANAYMARRGSVPEAERAVYDKNLVNTFLRVTHPKGDQISNFERKDLGGMPALPARIEQAVVGFFEGRYVPDDVAGYMGRVINEKFKAREAQVADLENKMVDDVKRQGGSPESIRRITRGGRGRQPGPGVPPPPPGFTLD